uniref:Uncharacterized protein n=1 Tax=uncultured marine virus TaxID=186617 RepID=A0A0F7L9N1_9VIRU|nr:hypothetical protein [uncultured marine virus]
MFNCNSRISAVLYICLYARKLFFIRYSTLPLCFSLFNLNSFKSLEFLSSCCIASTSILSSV